ASPHHALARVATGWRVDERATLALCSLSWPNDRTVRQGIPTDGGLEVVQFAIASGFTGMPCYFNLTMPIRKGYPYSPVVDVSLVQFCFVAGVTSNTPPGLVAAWSKVTVTGQTDDATLAAVNAWQAFRRQRFGPSVDVDGIVSVARTQTGLYGAGAGMSYDIVHLNFMMLFGTASIWPRIDKHPRCSTALSEAIRRALGGHVTP